MVSTKRSSVNGRGGLSSSAQPVRNLDLAVVPFTVEHKGKVRRSRKRRSSTNIAPRRGSPSSTTHGPSEGLFPVTIIVRPRDKWEALKQRSIFMINDESFRVGQSVFINHSDITQGTDLSEADLHDFWAAEVVEIRANDAQHVYLRVAWYYWPEELPGGRRYYHGMKELVASNHMEIIQATTVAGHASIRRWKENNSSEELDGFFWRQRLNIITKKLTPVEKYCICDRAHNPDKVMIGCANPHCRKWLHSECIVKNTIREICATNIQPQSPIATATPTVSPTRTINSELMALSPPPTGPDGDATFSLTLPPRATTAANPTTKHREQSFNTFAQSTTSIANPFITGRIENGEHGLRIIIAERTRTRVDSSVVMASADIEDEGQEGSVFWEEKVYCPACRAIIL
ncbi:hypothetical protein GP486_000443 [Trichoglossum hirsutum]|uniref:BAH domain-containing protein n=1 Tax=Trichoglossum hirsutum TaxID=265104 RepID=A0A9P8RTM8_9PEZI|nr:hypothetical protein GP486_000443 [Trichoglossum hirsutum]